MHHIVQPDHTLEPAVRIDDVQVIPPCSEEAAEDLRV